MLWNLQNGDVAYKQFFKEEEQKDFPDCSLRFYNISEIINAVIDSGFMLKKFDEIPSWNSANIPGEFVIVGVK